MNYETFIKCYDWQYYLLKDKVTIEYKQIGSKHTEFISGRSLEEAFENLFKILET